MLLEEMSDEDLIFLMKSGSEIAERAIYRRYNNYAKHEAQSYYKSFKHSYYKGHVFYGLLLDLLFGLLIRVSCVNSGA